MENRIIFDYLAFSSTIDSPDSIIKLLGLSDDIVSNHKSCQVGKQADRHFVLVLRTSRVDIYCKLLIR